MSDNSSVSDASTVLLEDYYRQRGVELSTSNTVDSHGKLLIMI